MTHSLWCDNGPLHPDLVPWFEGQHSRGLNVTEQLTVTEPHPVGPTLLLPVGLYIQVMESITVHLWREAYHKYLKIIHNTTTRHDLALCIGRELYSRSSIVLSNIVVQTSAFTVVKNKQARYYTHTITHVQVKMFITFANRLVLLLIPHLHDSPNVSQPHLLISLTATHHHTHADVVTHIASILIHTREVLTTLEALVICTEERVNPKLPKSNITESTIGL